MLIDCANLRITEVVTRTLIAMFVPFSLAIGNIGGWAPTFRLAFDGRILVELEDHGFWG